MQPVNPSKRAQAVEILRAISEVIIYGDQRQTNQIFDYFCEKNMLFLFTQMLHVPGGCGSAISRQIIQTVSILVQNIQNPTYLFYLLSNNHVNEIILHKFDFRDEDVLAQYASFVKMLSLLLDENTIQFMFDGRQASFPLYTESIKLMDSTEGMVRTHSRVLALNVYRMSDDAMAQFILSPAHRGVFGKLVRYVRGRCMQLGNRLRGTLGGINSSDGNPSGNNSKKKKRSFSSPRLFSSPSRQNKWPSHQQQKQQKQQKQQSITVDQIKSEVNDVIDEFYFFQDVLEAGKHGISDALSDAILIHLIYPCLIPALGLQEGNNRTNGGQDGGSGNGDGNGSGRNGERDNSQSRSFNNKSHILQSSPRHRSRGMSSHAYDVSTPDGGVGSQVSTLLSLFMLTQLMYAMQHDNIIHAIAVCCMSRGRVDGSAVVEEEKDNTVNRGNQESNGEPDLFSFIVGFKDPMVKKDEKTKATEATEAAALEIQKHTKGHASAMPPCHNYIVPIPPPPSQLLTKTVDYQSEDTDYEDDEKEGVDGVDGVDGVEEEDSRPRRGSSFSSSLDGPNSNNNDRLGNDDERTFPTSSNIHRLRILASLVSQDERHVLMTIMLLRSFIRTMDPSFLANVGLLPVSMLGIGQGNEDEGDEGDDDDEEKRRKRARTRTNSGERLSSPLPRRRTWSSSYGEVELMQELQGEVKEGGLRERYKTEEPLVEAPEELEETEGTEGTESDQMKELKKASERATHVDTVVAVTKTIEPATPSVVTSMGRGVVLQTRPDDGVQIVELEWKLANQSKAIMYTTTAVQTPPIAPSSTTALPSLPPSSPTPSSPTPSSPTPSSPTPSSPPTSIPTKQQFQYPTVLVESLLSVLAREARSPNFCRLLTFRAVVTFLMELVSDPNARPGQPLVHPLHLGVVTCAISRCSSALRLYLKDSNFLERPNHRFIEIFETEHRIVLNNYENDVTLDTIAGRCELLLSVAHGPTTGKSGRSTALEDRHPFGDVENVRQLVRVSLLLRQLEMKLGGIPQPQRLIDDDDERRESSGRSDDLEQENELVDLTRRKHVQCRLRKSKMFASQDERESSERPIFLIVTPLVMSIAEVVALPATPVATDSRVRRSASNQKVKNTSIVPIHLIDAIVDSTDNKTLHLTVFSHTQPKLFQQLGGTTGGNGGKSSSLSGWRMTVGFANPGACSWTKATIEKHRADLRREKLGRICTMLGISEFFSESTL